MTILPQSPASSTGLDRERRLAAAADLLRAHRDERDRVDRAGRHIIAGAWDSGMSVRRAAELLAVSRTFVSVRLKAAQAAGKLTRPYQDEPALTATKS